jgi:DNA-binding NarL/FixJ family response regulator
VSDAEPLRVVVGEDEPLVRAGVVSVLREAGFEVVGEAADAADLARKVNAHQPDVVVADIQMPPKHSDDGLRAAQQIRMDHPDIGVVILSQHLETRYALELVGEGAKGVGYLLKDRVGDLSLFTAAVRRVARGGSALDPEVVERLVSRPRIGGKIGDLTPREREVLGLMAQGRSNAGIATELSVTVGAVENHVTAIFDKLGLRPQPELHRRVLAVLQYLKA